MCYDFVLQVMAAWRWSNFYERRKAAEKSLLRLNLDETCVRCFESHTRGNVFSAKRANEGALSQRQPKNKRRLCLTHVAIICDRPEVQNALPQFVIGNQVTFKKRDLEMLARECGPKLVLIRHLCVELVHSVYSAHIFFVQGRKVHG